MCTFFPKIISAFMGVYLTQGCIVCQNVVYTLSRPTCNEVNKFIHLSLRPVNNDAGL